MLYYESLYTGLFLKVSVAFFFVSADIYLLLSYVALYLNNISSSYIFVDIKIGDIYYTSDIKILTVLLTHSQTQSYIHNHQLLNRPNTYAKINIKTPVFITKKLVCIMNV